MCGTTNEIDQDQPRSTKSTMAWRRDITARFLVKYPSPTRLNVSKSRFFVVGCAANSADSCDRNSKDPFGIWHGHGHEQVDIIRIWTYMNHSFDILRILFMDVAWYGYESWALKLFITNRYLFDGYHPTITQEQCLEILDLGFKSFMTNGVYDHLR